MAENKGIRINHVKQSREVVADLEARFLEGERLTVEQIVREVFQTTSYINTVKAQEIVKSWLNSLKKRFTRNYNVWFGNLNDQGEYGLCETDAEYRYVITRYRNFVLGNVKRTMQVATEAKNKGYLEDLTQIKMLVPEIKPVDQQIS